MGDFSIMDYSNARLITIQNGIARRQNGTFKIIHSIDITQYKNLTLDIEYLLDKNVTYNHPLRPFIRQQINDINGILNRLSPSRKQRSIDFIGSAWKWIAGTPDSHDFEVLEQKIGNILENNNRQLIINRLVSERISEITNVTNEIIKRKKEGWNDETANNLERKLILIEKELKNIELAIPWAKADIINTFILSEIEIEEINNIFKNYNIPVYNIEELLTFGSVKIVTNKKEILYILSIPITMKDVCNVYLAKAVKSRNLIDKIEYQNILQCNNSIFAIKDKCKKYYDLTICHRNNLIELRDDFCITSLFKNRIGNCTQVNNEHVPAVEEIGTDLILLNQYQGTISLNKEMTYLNGTYLIKHFNSTIEIDGRQYYSKEITGNKPLPAFLQPKSFDERVEEVISLELLKQLNTKNIKRLDILEVRNLSTIGICGFAVSVLMIITIFLLRGKLHKPTRKTIATPDETEMTENGEGPEVKQPTTSKDSKASSIYNIHSF